MLLKYDQKWTVEKGRSILLVSKPEKTRAKEKVTLCLNHYNAENRKTRQDSNALALICMVKLRSHPPSRS